MTDREDHESFEYELVMPFVACTSQGGPYDDAAFTAGWRLGQLDAELEAAEGHDVHDWCPLPTAQVHPADLPMVDLIAMRYGFTTSSEPWPDGPEEWVTVKFAPASRVPS